MPILKKRREVLPVDVGTPNDVRVGSAAGEEVPRSPRQKEEVPRSAGNSEGNNLQLEKTISVNTPGGTLSPRQSLPTSVQPAKEKEKKRVKLREVPTVRAGSGNSPGSPRSVPSLTPAPSPRAAGFLRLFSVQLELGARLI